MPLYNFDPHQQYSSIDKIPDTRTDEERLNPLLALYNPDSMDMAYAERSADELINLSGAWITVYKRNRKTGHRDEVWDEDADPTYKLGVKMKGLFAPAPAEILLTKFGVDIQNQTTVHFARTAVLKQFGLEMIAEGDVLVIPHNTLTVTQNTDARSGPLNRMDTFRVIKSSDTNNFRYRWLYWSCLVENLTGDVSIQVDHRNEQS